MREFTLGGRSERGFPWIRPNILTPCGMWPMELDSGSVSAQEPNPAGVTRLAAIIRQDRPGPAREHALSF